MKIPPLLFVCNGVNLHFDDPADPFILILSYHIILLWNYLSLLGTCSTLSMKSVFQPSLLGSITNVLTFQPKKTWRPVMTLRRRYERPKLHHETSLPMAIAMLKIICICQVTLKVCCVYEELVAVIKNYIWLNCWLIADRKLHIVQCLSTSESQEWCFQSNKLKNIVLIIK